MKKPFGRGENAGNSPNEYQQRQKHNRVIDDIVQSQPLVSSVGASLSLRLLSFPSLEVITAITNHQSIISSL